MPITSKILKQATVISLISAFNANAACGDSIEIGAITFNHNSSYFGTTGSDTLNKLIESQQAQANTESGYLVLEFEFDRDLGNADMQKYNMWLNERRVLRVKEFLTKGGFGSAMVSRILTAGNPENRAVKLFWCAAPDMPEQTGSEPTEQMLAEQQKRPREPFIKAL